LLRESFVQRRTSVGKSYNWIEYRTTRQEDVVDRLRGATIAITNRLRLGRAELERLPELRMIAVAATGHDQIDIVACNRRDGGGGQLLTAILRPPNAPSQQRAQPKSSATVVVEFGRSPAAGIGKAQSAGTEFVLLVGAEGGT
jgi:hypothetical protein